MPDVIVIGAGVVGAAAAYAAARAGARVVVIDANLPGAASRAGAGIVAPVAISPASEQWYDLAFPAVRHYATLTQQLIEDGVPDTGHCRVGAL